MLYSTPPHHPSTLPVSAYWRAGIGPAKKATSSFIMPPPDQPSRPIRSSPQRHGMDPRINHYRATAMLKPGNAPRQPSTIIMPASLRQYRHNALLIAATKLRKPVPDISTQYSEFLRCCAQWLVERHEQFLRSETRFQANYDPFAAPQKPSGASPCKHTIKRNH